MGIYDSSRMVISQCEMRTSGKRGFGRK